MDALHSTSWIGSDDTIFRPLIGSKICLCCSHRNGYLRYFTEDISAKRKYPPMKQHVFCPAFRGSQTQTRIVRVEVPEIGGAESGPEREIRLSMIRLKHQDLILSKLNQAWAERGQPRATLVKHE